MSHTIAPLAEMPDAELADLYASADDVARRAVLDECARRDRRAGLERAREVNAQIYAEWRIAAHAQYLAAEQECRGELVNNAGERAVRDGFALWSMPGPAVERYASDELKEFFLASPRLTFGTYRRQRAADQRAAREDARSPITDMTDYESAWTTEGSRDEQHTAERAAVDGPAQAGHGRISGPDTVRPGRDGQQRPAAEAGRVRYAGSVQPGRRVMTVTAPTVPGHAEARAAGCKHPRTRFNTPAQCEGCLGDKLLRAASAPTAPMLPAPRDSAPPARTGGSVAVRQSQQIPGDQLLDTVRKWLGMYARFPSPAALDVVTLWVAHSHCRDEGGEVVFRATPRLWLLSSEPGSGKSRVLKLLNMLCPETHGLTIEPTGPGVTKAMKNHETLLLDEADILFGKGSRHVAVRGIMNGGYTRDNTSLTANGRDQIFGVIAMAGLDILEKDTGEKLKALLSRGFKIPMCPAGRDNRPAKITRTTEAQAAQLKIWLAAWAAQERDALADAEPVMPDELADRCEEIAEPLVAVGDAAGGDWGAIARAACLELALAAPTAPEEDAPPVTDQLAGFAASLGTGVEYDEDDEDWTDEEGGDEEAPLTPPSPAYEPPVTYRAFVAVQGQGTRPLVCDVTDPAFARAVCESTAEARALGRPLQWVQSADGKAWTAKGETDAVAWAVAAE